jgi:hypothetical protein
VRDAAWDGFVFVFVFVCAGRAGILGVGETERP